MTRPRIVRTRNELRHCVAEWRSQALSVALAPTMGALHAGHLSLVSLASRHADRVVVSVFVNPAQFAPHEDFSAYPRDEVGDSGLLARVGCDVMYAPPVGEIYPDGFSTSVTVAGVSAGMEGAARPSHFVGVATVVAKLMIQAGPDLAVFGEKDYQQLQVIRRMVRDLDLPVRILAGAIVRDSDGLALSSRNANLTSRQRAVAPGLHRTLIATGEGLSAGQRVEVAEAMAREALVQVGFDAVDYVEVRSPESLDRLGPGPLTEPGRLLAVARLGQTRLLDNIAVAPPPHLPPVGRRD